MTLSIIGLLNRYPTTIQKTIDLTLERASATGQRYQRGLPDPVLLPYTPIRRYASPKIAIQKLNERRPTIAFIVGVDGEIPIRHEPTTLSIEEVGSAKLARGRLFTERDYELMREAEMELAIDNREAYRAFVDQYMQTPAQLTTAITILARLLQVQVHFSGACTYIDPETGIGFELSYLSQVPANNRPAALSGGALWSAASTATPLADLRGHLNNYYTEMLMLPEVIVMGSLAADAMLNANDTKNKIARMKGMITSEADFSSGALANVQRPSLADVRQWLSTEVTTAAQGLENIPQIVVSDCDYFPLNADGTIGNGTRFFPANTYFFANEGVVEGAFVPTATNDFRTPMAFVTEEVSKSPRREKATMDTRYLVLCNDPRKLGWRQVLA